MKDLTELVTVAMPLLLALVVVLQSWMAWKIQKIEHHSNAARDALVGLAKEKGHAEGRLEESKAAAIGETTKGQPIP